MRIWVERFDLNLLGKQLLTILIIDLAVILQVLLFVLRESFFLFFPWLKVDIDLFRILVGRNL